MEFSNVHSCTLLPQMYDIATNSPHSVLIVGYMNIILAMDVFFIAYEGEGMCVYMCRVGINYIVLMHVN